MRKHLIITLAIAALTATTACGKKDAYRSSHYGSNQIHDKTTPKTPPPPADPSMETQALRLLNGDKAFNSVHDTDLSVALEQSVKGASLTIETVREGQGFSDAQAELSLLTSDQSTTCVPAVTKSDEFARADLFKKGISFKNSRVTCIDKNCDNAILFVESKGGDFSEQESQLNASIAILLSRDSADGSLKPVDAQSELFAKASLLEDAVATCQKDLSDSTDPKIIKANRIIAINVQLTDLAKRIAVLQSRTGQDGDKALNLIASLQKQIDALNAEKASLEAAPATPAAPAANFNLSAESQARVIEIDKQLADIQTQLAQINTDMTAAQNGQTLVSIDTLAARTADLNKQKSDLETEKAALYGHM